MPELQTDCPVDLKALPPVHASSSEEVAAAVSKGRSAQSGWERLGFDVRAKRLRAAGRSLLERRQEVLEHLHDEAGKSPGEILMSEALGPLQYVRDWVKVARPYLRSKRLAMERV